MDSRKVIKYLKQYGQQQSLDAIRHNVDQDITHEDLAKLVESGDIVEADGGVDYRGEKQVHYAPADSGSD